MQLRVTKVVNHVETARHGLEMARKQLLRMIYKMDAADHRVTELKDIQAQLDEAVALSQMAHDYLSVWHESQVQHALDAYMGEDADSSASLTRAHVMPQSDTYDYSAHRFMHDGEDRLSLSPVSNDDDDDDFLAFLDDVTDTSSGYYGDVSDDDDEDDYISITDDCLNFDEYIMEHAQSKPTIILGDERAAVAFDTSDMAWATQPLSESVYRKLFGLSLDQHDDWHYDIFGNWYPGFPPHHDVDDPDYNIPF